MRSTFRAWPLRSIQSTHARLFLPVAMSELRVNLPDEIVAVLDGYCSATDKCRTETAVEIIGEWSRQKLHESIVICRVARVNPIAVETNRHG